MAKGSEPKQHLYVLAGTFAALLAIVIFSRFNGRQAPSNSLKGVVLANVAGTAQKDVGACARKKCVRVYISPWCTICQKSTPFLKGFKAWLEERGYGAEIIVGRDEKPAIMDYANVFGDDTLVDPGAAYPLRGGVPNFTVIDQNGDILKTVPGVPRIYTQPIRVEYFVETAGFLGLS